ncbi:MAG TPA: hypothetical protein VFS95_12200, partial [Telluria sp.]|nr:hypothetical protein [Telluria sp.]
MNGFGSAMVTLHNARVRLLAGAGVAFLLSACGGSSPPELLAASSDIAVGAPVPGPTPFISVVPLTGQSLKQVSIYRFQITPKAGAVSRPVDVRYTAAAMARRGFHADGSSTASLPVFGLYGGYTNQVKLEMIFTDGSRQENVVNIVTPAYVDPNAKLDRPTLLQRRTSAGPTLNYLFLKSALAGPLVMDSDAEVRWIAPGSVNAYTATFYDNAFYIGAQKALGLSRIE